MADKRDKYGRSPNQAPPANLNDMPSRPNSVVLCEGEMLCPGKPLSELAHPARALDCPSVSAAVSRTSIRESFRCS